jgi:predicted DNA-binding transcriptional regulator AlpA
MSTATMNADARARALPDRLVPRPEVARMFGITEQTVRIWEQDGRLPKSIKLGRRSYWRPEALAKILNPEAEG